MVRKKKNEKEVEILKKFDDDFVYLLGNGSQFALDIETTGLSHLRSNIAVISAYFPERPDVAYVLRPTQDLFRHLRNSELNVVTHNGTMFDLLFLRALEIVPDYHYDTMIGECVTALRRYVNVSLDQTMKRRLNKSFKTKIDHRSWSKENLSDEQLRYCANDVIYLIDIKKKQENLAIKHNVNLALTKEQDFSLKMSEVYYDYKDISKRKGAKRKYWQVDLTHCGMSPVPSDLQKAILGYSGPESRKLLLEDIRSSHFLRKVFDKETESDFKTYLVSFPWGHKRHYSKARTTWSTFTRNLCNALIGIAAKQEILAPGTGRDMIEKFLTVNIHGNRP